MSIIGAVSGTWAAGRAWATADGTAADPSSVLAGFLRAIGVPSSRIPDSVAERSRVFRSWTADRKVLIVLDDAVSVSQLAPLLPTGPGCVTMVAGRRRMAHPMIGTTIPLKPFGRANGVRLLNEALGRCRVVADQDAAYELVELCGETAYSLFVQHMKDRNTTWLPHPALKVGRSRPK